MIAPGISVAAIIDLMSLKDLERLVGDDLVDTIAGLNGSTPTLGELQRVAKSLYADNNPTPVQNDQIRNQLVEVLPLDKARELCIKLGIEESSSLYSSLKRLQFGSNTHTNKTLLTFFGIVEDLESTFVRQSATDTVKPEYGLFDYQRDVVLRTLPALREFPRKVLVHMPTGSGKTRTAMHIIARHLLERGPTVICWLANSAELLEQAAGEIERSWSLIGDRSIDIYRFWGNNDVDLGSVRDGVLVAGFAKLHAAYTREQNALISLGDRASLTVVDEAHQAVAPTYRLVTEALYTKQPSNALLGLTATPGRSWNDVEADKVLSEYFGEKKVTLAVKDYPDPVSFLIAEGYLAKPFFRTLNFDGPIGLPNNGNVGAEGAKELPQEVLERLSENSDRNSRIISTIEELMSRHNRVIFFGASVTHAHIVSSILVARGHDSQVITGETPSSTREKTIRRFKRDNARPMVLCNYGVLTTGFDAPKTSAAVIARPTRSLVLYSQMVGRAIRGPRAQGNVDAEIVTVVDTALPGFGDVTDAFKNWEDVWDEY